jgi:PAS domain S-box-containing protein
MDRMQIDEPRVITSGLEGDEDHPFERVLLDAISDIGEGVVVTEAGRCVYANDAYCEMTGYSRAELEALPTLIDLAPEEEREALISRLRDRLGGGHVQDHYEAGLVTKSGRRKRVEVAVKLLSDASGGRLIAIIRDVTERQRLEEFKDLFAARVSHEMRNAVTPLLGLIGLLSDRYEELDERTAQDMVGALKRQGDRLSELIDRMLDLTKFEQGELILKPQRTHVLAIVRNVVEAARETTEKDLVAEVDEDLIAWVDPVRLDQMLTNLVGNSIKYGGRRIVVDGERRDGRVSVRVLDDGDAIPPADADRIFDAFSRGSSTPTTGGTGLGLAITRAYARASDGEVWYEAARPVGNRFVVELPDGPPPAENITP